MAHSPTQPAKPAHLVYLLDHSYTEHSLRWQYLKGNDHVSAGAFRHAAQKLGLVTHLALAQLHQSWTATGGDDGGGGYGHRRGAPSEPEPDELIDSDLTLSAWMNAQSQSVAYKTLHTRDDQTCMSTELGELDLVDSEYEGFMGNYGETLDYWYQRGAIVVWRVQDQIMFDFDLNRNQSMQAFTALIQQPGNEGRVAEIVQQAGAFLFSDYRHPNAADWASIAGIGAYISHPELAFSLLERCSIRAMTLAYVAPLKRLQDVYGVDWCERLLQKWATNAKDARTQLPALELADFLQRADENALDRRLCRVVIDDGINAYIHDDTMTASTSATSAARRNAALPTRLKTCSHIARACAWLNDSALTDAWVAHVKTHPLLYPALELAQLLMQLQTQGVDRNKSGSAVLLQYVEPHLRDECNRGLREPGDWSISASAACRCQYCTTAMQFVHSPTEAERIWPLAAVHRSHVMSQLRDLDLPLHFEERKQGSPHKLVMTKDQQLYPQATRRYEQVKVCYAALRAMS